MFSHLKTLRYTTLGVPLFLFLSSPVWFESLLQNVSIASPTSRMPVPMSAKIKQQLGTSDRERATKQLKLQDSQRQFRQVVLL